MAERFWSHVDRSAGPGSCWPWTGSKDRDGYGRFFVRKDARRTIVGAHRFVLGLDGRPAADGQDAAHVCDNPPCCNPKHVEAVTHTENLRQMRLRGRGRGPGKAARVAVAASMLLAGRGPGGVS